MDEDDDDRRHLRVAIEASRRALAAGDMPYGAVLVRGGAVVQVATNRQCTSGDCTAHAETELVREACARFGADAARGATVYASGEPCAMCCGVMFWSGVRRIVYSASQAEMARVMGGDLLPISARDVLAGSVPPVEVVGPLLEADALAVLLEAAAGRAR